jgi:hypothetical protein
MGGGLVVSRASSGKKRNALRARGQSDQVLCESLRGFCRTVRGTRVYSDSFTKYIVMYMYVL